MISGLPGGILVFDLAMATSAYLADGCLVCGGV